MMTKTTVIPIKKPKVDQLHGHEDRDQGEEEKEPEHADEEDPRAGLAAPEQPFEAPGKAVEVEDAREAPDHDAVPRACSNSSSIFLIRASALISKSPWREVP